MEFGVAKTRLAGRGSGIMLHGIGSPRIEPYCIVACSAVHRNGLDWSRACYRVRGSEVLRHCPVLS
jgi:hypothetical protein